MKREKFVVFDGNAIVHRAYHAIPPMTTSRGEVVNAAYGYTSMILKVFSELSPDYAAVAFDLAAPTFRHQEYAEYKATRVKGPDDLYEQFRRVREITEALSIPIFEKEGYEADDVIGTISKQVSRDIDVVIVTGDLDELQLVAENVKVYTMRRGFTDTVIYDLNAVKERYGLTPEEFIDYKALKGDASDNIPGVAGIGEKTACDLILRYQNIENLYKHLDELKGKIKEKLENGKESAFISKKLSRIDTDVLLRIDLDKARTHEFDRQVVFNLFRELEFKSLLNRLPDERKQADLFGKIKKEKPHLKECRYHLVNSVKALEELVSKIKESMMFSIDTETDSINSIKANLVGLSISFQEGTAYYIPIAHQEGENLQKDLAIEKLNPIFSNKKIKKIGHNLKYDYIVLSRAGFKLKGIYFDTMIAAYLLNQNLRSPKLDDLAFRELGIEKISIKEIIGDGKHQTTFDQVPHEIAYKYACEDADIPLRLFKILDARLRKNNLKKLFYKIEMPLVTILAEMEMAGILVDSKVLNIISKKFETRIKILEKEIYDYAGEKFNINSPSQLQKILFEKLNLQDLIFDKKELKKVKSGGYSTGAEELLKLQEAHPIITKISDYRELTKLKSTYIDTLPKLINKATGRIHTNFNQAITATGRLSSSDPNLQNIPIRTDEGREIRKAFIAGEGNVLLSVDYSQIELRVIADLADDKEMIETFKRGEDVHASTAAKVYGVAIDQVDESMRRKAKAVNFGIIYGVRAHGLKQSTGMSREEAQDFIDKYFEINKGVKKYTEKIIEKARAQGYVETIFGRKRFLPEITSNNFIIRGQAERMALNMPIQGTAADIIKLAMIEITERLPQVSMKSRMLLQVHDELVFEVPENELKKVQVFVTEIMERTIKLKVPVKASAASGKNWAEAK